VTHLRVRLWNLILVKWLYQTRSEGLTGYSDLSVLGGSATAGRPRESEDRAAGVTWTMAEDGWMDGADLPKAERQNQMR
jgi:hypothetical protein